MSGGHDDYQVEPIPGLPEALPPGEHILWQGGPQWWPLARDVFHIRAVALYLVALLAWRATAHLTASGDARPAMAAVLSLVPVAALALGLLAGLAWLADRTTVYTITNRRVVLRVGIALPTAINIPFGMIGSVGLRLGSGGGDIALCPLGTRMAYSTLWPHARPWRINRPEPMLRALADAEGVASLLGAALRDALPAAPPPSPERVPARPGDRRASLDRVVTVQMT